LVVAAAVEESPRSDPPASAVEGACYIIGPSASGVWAGKSGCIAGFTSGGWRFIAPVEGVSAYVKATGTWAIYRSATWELGVLRGDTSSLEGFRWWAAGLARSPRPAAVRLWMRTAGRLSIKSLPRFGNTALSTAEAGYWLAEAVE
jgi:hypothetical protein